MGEDAGRCMTHDLWASLNSKMIEFLDSVSLKKLVDEQLAKGVSIEEQPGQAGDLDAAGRQADQDHRAELGVRARRRLLEVTGLQSPAARMRHDPALPDLHGLRRDDAGRSARRRRDDPVVARALRQPGVAQPRLGLGSRGGGREGARAGRGADRRRPARDRLDLGRDRVRQPGAEGRGAVLQDARQAPDHRQDRAQGGARHDARARAPGLRGDLPRRPGRRPARPRPAARRRCAPTRSWSR